MSTDTSNAAANFREEDLRAAELCLLGDRLCAEGSYQKAIDAYRKSITRAVTTRSTYLKLARAYFKYGESDYRPDAGEEARVILQKMVDLNPDDSCTYSELIAFYVSLGKWAEAGVAAEKYIGLNVLDSNYYLAQSVRAYKSGDYQNVIEAAEKSIARDPNSTLAYYLLGLGYGFLDNQKSIAALERSLEIDPTNAYVATSLASEYLAAERYAESAAVDEGLIKQGENGNLFRLAMSYAYLDRFEEAANILRTALDRLEGYPLGLIAHQNSIKALKRVVEFDQDLSHARLACLLASYAEFSFSRMAHRMGARTDVAVRDCLWWYQKALEYPESPGASDSLEWQIHYRAGETYHDVFQYQEACEAFQRSVGLHPGTYSTLEMSRPNGMFPLEQLSASLVAAEQLEQGIDAQRRHLAIIHEAETLWREQLQDFEVKRLKSDDSRIVTCTHLLKTCADYALRARQRLAELLYTGSAPC